MINPEDVMRRIGYVGCAVVALMAACRTKETAQQMQARMDKDTDAFKQATAGIGRRWESWVAAGQADSIAGIFMDQGREMPPDGPAVVGRAAIRQFEAQNAAAFDGKLTIKSEAGMASGALGVERGSYTFQGKAKPGAPRGIPPTVTEEGKYLIHWHNVNGQWQVADIIWNTNRPMVMAGPAPKAKPAKPAKKAPRKK